VNSTNGNNRLLALLLKYTLLPFFGVEYKYPDLK